MIESSKAEHMDERQQCRQSLKVVGLGGGAEVHDTLDQHYTLTLFYLIQLNALLTWHFLSLSCTKSFNSDVMLQRARQR